MKKAVKKIMSLVLIATFIFSVASTAYASHVGYEANDDTKSTPYGTLSGALYVYAGADGPQDYEITACTTIDSDYTMSRTTTKMECVDSRTGESIEDRNSTSNSERNSNHCDLQHYHYVTGPITVYTTHEVTYTNSYVLYMSTDL